MSIKNKQTEGYAFISSIPNGELTVKVSKYLESLFCSNATYSKFRSKHIPSTSLEVYFQRILQFVEPPHVLLVCIIYAKRCSQRQFLDAFSVHRFCLACVLIASKVFSDRYLTNRVCAKIGGISNKEINSLELQLLLMLSFNVQIDLSEFERTAKILEEFIQS